MKPLEYLLLAAILLGGCSANPVSTGWPPIADSSLQTWTREVLSPYLVEKLSQHPKFKGQPVIVVKMDGPDVQPDIDELTHAIRTEMHDALLQVPGVTLPWQPRAAEHVHHRRADNIQCRKLRDAPYYIGIQTSQTLSGQSRISIRALDVNERKWINGFTLNWQGELTRHEQQSLLRKHPDEALRGLRVLPFSHTQLDMAADYLANNISCLLRQQDEDDLLVHVEADASDTPLLPKLMDLVGNNLSRYREVRIAETREEADFLLYGAAHRLQPDLYQVWTRISKRNNSVHLPGIDTATYLTTGKDFPATTEVDPGTPRISALELSIGKGTVCPAGRSSNGDGCVLLQLNVEDSEDLFVIRHSAPGQLSRVYPTSCRVETNAGGTDGTQTYQIALAPDMPPYRSTVYAIAAGAGHIAKQLSLHLQSLPDDCSAMETGTLRGSQFNSWLAQLDRILKSNGNHLSWAAKRLL